ncbi:hypothetical protein RclHR1_19350001 [Rhizophagus clarus]|uniref:Uncharacterized protein n=1 Tax=Rhizophagus clarus TaxID=94130 RepID=A0A2Z6QR13_9GLOM|nr:hypothetical protein RclHR1_19350001 [Rhizophagus clarus]
MNYVLNIWNYYTKWDGRLSIIYLAADSLVRLKIEWNNYLFEKNIAPNIARIYYILTVCHKKDDLVFRGSPSSNITGIKSSVDLISRI